MATERIVELNDLNFDATVLGATGPVLVEFTGTWCPPCRAQAPILERLADEARGSVVVATVDADAHPDLGSRYCVRGLPTLIVFADGKEVGRRLGLTTIEGLRKLLGHPMGARSLDIEPNPSLDKLITVP